MKGSNWIILFNCNYKLLVIVGCCYIVTTYLLWCYEINEEIWRWFSVITWSRLINPTPILQGQKARETFLDLKKFYNFFCVSNPSNLFYLYHPCPYRAYYCFLWVCHHGKLPLVTKTEFLLTVLLHFQAERWWIKGKNINKGYCWTPNS